MKSKKVNRTLIKDLLLKSPTAGFIGSERNKVDHPFEIKGNGYFWQFDYENDIGRKKFVREFLDEKLNFSQLWST